MTIKLTRSAYAVGARLGGSAQSLGRAFSRAERRAAWMRCAGRRSCVWAKGSLYSCSGFCASYPLTLPGGDESHDLAPYPGEPRANRCLHP